MPEAKEKVVLINDIGGFVIDGVFENKLSLSIDKTTYPIEIGAEATDHAIIQDIKYNLKGGVSNISTGLSITNIATGVASNFIGSLGSTVLTTATSAALSEDDKSAKALRTLMGKLTEKKIFSIFTGEIQIDNLMITSFERIRDPSNENALIFDIEMTEMKTIDLLTGESTSFEPNPDNVQDDNTKSQAAKLMEKGQKAFSSVSESTAKEFSSLSKSAGGFF